MYVYYKHWNKYFLQFDLKPYVLWKLELIRIYKVVRDFLYALPFQKKYIQILFFK